MAIDYQQLKVDDAAGHPVTGPFNADTQLAADEWNALNRDGPPDSGLLLQYVLLERFRTGNIYGRIFMVANTTTLRAGNSWELPPLPLGVGGADVVPSFDQIQSASSFLRILDTDTSFAVSLLDGRIDTILQDLVGVDAIGGGDKTAIQGFSQGVQSYANELGYGRLGTNDIIRARNS